MEETSHSCANEEKKENLKSFVSLEGQIKSPAQIVVIHQALVCIVFRQIRLYESNGYGLFEGIDVISTPQNIRQEYGCVQRILMRAASQSVSQAILKASITVTQSVS
jgi:hypothetical protein